MRHIVMTIAIIAAGSLLAGDAFGQACPNNTRNLGVGGANNLMGGGSMGGNRRQASGTAGAGANSLVSQYLAAMNMGGGGIGGGMGGMSGAGGTLRANKRNRNRNQMQKTARERSRHTGSAGGKIASDEQRATRFLQSAEAAESRGDLRVAYAYYRLASRTGETFEADQAKLELERLSKALAAK